MVGCAWLRPVSSRFGSRISVTVQKGSLEIHVSVGCLCGEGQREVGSGGGEPGDIVGTLEPPGLEWRTVDSTEETAPQPQGQRNSRCSRSRIAQKEGALRASAAAKISGPRT